MLSLALTVVSASMLRSEPENTFLVPVREVSIEAPDVAVRRDTDAVAIATAMLIHDRSIRSFDSRLLIVQPDLPEEKAVNQTRHIRIDDRGRYWMRVDRRNEWSNGLPGASRPTEPADIIQMQDHGEFVESLSEVTKQGGVRVSHAEIRTPITPLDLLGRAVEYNKFPRRLGEILLSSPTLEFVSGPSPSGIVTLRSSMVLDSGSSFTLDVDVATRHDFAVVGILRYDASFNALRRVTRTHTLSRIQGKWFPTAGFKQRFEAAPMNSKDEQRFIDSMNSAGFKEGMNAIDPKVQEMLRAGYRAYSGASHIPTVAFFGGRDVMSCVDMPQVNLPLTTSSLSIDRTGLVLWGNDLTGEWTDFANPANSEKY